MKEGRRNADEERVSGRRGGDEWSEKEHIRGGGGGGGEKRGHESTGCNSILDTL